jgi:hypothetical protein
MDDPVMECCACASAACDGPKDVSTNGVIAPANKETIRLPIRRHAELVSASTGPQALSYDIFSDWWEPCNPGHDQDAWWMLKQVQHDEVLVAR